jgi:hypothetical protein
MRKTTKTTLLVVGIVALVLLVSPALAAFRIISDTFDKETNTGVVIVQIDKDLYAKILYRDMDDSQSFSRGDTRLKITYFRRHKGVGPAPSGPSLDGLSTLGSAR